MARIFSASLLFQAVSTSVAFMLEAVAAFGGVVQRPVRQVLGIGI